MNLELKSNQKNKLEWLCTSNPNASLLSGTLPTISLIKKSFNKNDIKRYHTTHSKKYGVNSKNIIKDILEKVEVLEGKKREKDYKKNIIDKKVLAEEVRSISNLVNEYKKELDLLMATSKEESFVLDLVKIFENSLENLEVLLLRMEAMSKI